MGLNAHPIYNLTRDLWTNNGL
jgi:autophagy-related protein 33